jgi:hypothetical protein
MIYDLTELQVKLQEARYEPIPSIEYKRRMAATKRKAVNDVVELLDAGVSVRDTSDTLSMPRSKLFILYPIILALDVNSLKCLMTT